MVQIEYIRKELFKRIYREWANDVMVRMYYGLFMIKISVSPGSSAVCPVCEKQLPASRHHAQKYCDATCRRKASSLVKAPCSIEGCARIAAVRTWCWKHYDRWRNNGDPLTLGPRGERGDIIKDFQERFWSKVEKTAGCWLWIGDKSRRGGYGKIANRGGTTLAHRISYEMENGPIPEGLVIDHLCGEQSCVRPAHLEAVTVQVNSSRAASRRGSGVCGRGHDKSTPGVRRVRKDGTTYCGFCANAAQQDRRRIKRAIKAALAWVELNDDAPVAILIREIVEALRAGVEKHQLA
jgi:hypothetical protein